MKNNKILSNTIVIFFFLLLCGCLKKPLPRTIKGTIIDTTTQTTIKDTKFVLVYVKDMGKLNTKLKQLPFSTNKKGFFNYSIDASLNDEIRIFFYDSTAHNIGHTGDSVIYKFTITKNKEYNLTIKTKKP